MAPVGERCEPDYNGHYLYLAHENQAMKRNIWNIRVGSFFEISIIFGDGSLGTLMFEKGETGAKTIYKALQDWGQWPHELVDQI
jgi:hypothetical protein